MATAISVSIVASGPKGRRTVNGMPTGGSRHPKTGNPAPFQISPASPYMLMNLGQRDEPSMEDPKLVLNHAFPIAVCFGCLKQLANDVKNRKIYIKSSYKGEPIVTQAGGSMSNSSDDKPKPPHESRPETGKRRL